MKKILSLALILTLILSIAFTIPASAQHIINCGDLWLKPLNEGTAEVGSTDTSLTGRITIPETLDSYTVTKIANSGFSGTNITEVIITNTVTHIDDYAFSDCPLLEMVIIPEGVTSLGEGVFKNCPNLTTITIPSSVTDMGLFSIGYEDNYIDNDGEMLPDGGYAPGTPVTIRGYGGTAAEAYAREHHLAFIDITPHYKDKVLALLNIPEEDPGTGEGWLSSYHEGYEYFSAPNESGEATPDYVLIKAHTNEAGPMFAAELLGDYILRSYNHYFPATFGYLIYLPKTNEIYSLEEAFQMKLEGIDSVFTEGGIGELLGDVNYDRKLNIKDATLIQKHLAGLEEIKNNEIDGFMWNEEENVPTYIGDFNCDRKMNIKDATAIQKHIAGLDRKNIDYTVLEISEVISASDTPVNTIVGSRTELKRVLAKITETVGPFEPDEKFSDEYFKDKAVIVIADRVADPQLVAGVSILGNSLTVHRYVDTHEDATCYQYMLIEVAKQDVGAVSQIQAENTYALICY
ncbi:MAG: leucine-rich repeat protein [Ruminococcus sp.]|nr:leucine-rich repeat protein [Ruminococcus sp.]